eukprot:3422445-Pyramimonas_sp.AAC.3
MEEAGGQKCMGKRRVAIVGAGSECSPQLLKRFTLHVNGVLTPFTRPVHTTNYTNRGFDTCLINRNPHRPIRLPVLTDVTVVGCTSSCSFRLGVRQRADQAQLR